MPLVPSVTVAEWLRRQTGGVLSLYGGELLELRFSIRREMNFHSSSALRVPPVSVNIGPIACDCKSEKYPLTTIANCNITIADCNMKLGEKLKYLREVEGTLRGLNREMTQQDVVRAIKLELGESISQSYLSQIESGARPHLTNATRQLLARFFKVHPGYLVDDPEGYHTELISDVRTAEDQLDLWLVEGSERFQRDPAVSQALLSLAKHDDSRKCLMLLEEIIETPGLIDRLFQVLKPEPRKETA